MRAIGIAGWSGAGKTTLITRLIPELNRRGLGISTIKHAHHSFDVDQPGKDFMNTARRARGRCWSPRRSGSPSCANCWVRRSPRSQNC